LVHLDTPEKRVRQQIDAALIESGWRVQSRDAVNLNAGRGVAVREFRLKPGHGYADYLLYVDGQALGVIEAKKEGDTLTGVEVQAEKYAAGMPDALPAPYCPLPSSIRAPASRRGSPTASTRPRAAGVCSHQLLIERDGEMRREPHPDYLKPCGLGSI
jgi:type I restriction enzyme R subunit